LSIAGGSLAETETLLMLADRTKLVPSGEVTRGLALADEVGRMIGALKRRLKAEVAAPARP
jgi:four helix bundle protein